MAEWSIAAVLKTVEGHTSGGSNPSLSAELTGPEMDSKWTKSYKSMICGFFYCPKVLLPRLQKYGKRQSFVTKSLPIPHRTKTVTICP